MAIHFRSGDYCCTNLLDGDDRLYRVVPGFRCGMARQVIPPDAEIGMTDSPRSGLILYRLAAEQVRRLRAGEIVDCTVTIIPRGTIVADNWY